MTGDGKKVHVSKCARRQIADMGNPLEDYPSDRASASPFERRTARCNIPARDNHRSDGAKLRSESDAMPPTVDIYNTSYGNYERDVYREVRLETYGEDFGQTSWVTTEESHEIPRLLELTPGCSVLEIGSGSGRYALYVAATGSLPG